jgi:hypothetical protein
MSDDELLALDPTPTTTCGCFGALSTWVGRKLQNLTLVNTTKDGRRRSKGSEYDALAAMEMPNSPIGLYTRRASVEETNTKLRDVAKLYGVRSCELVKSNNNGGDNKQQQALTVVVHGPLPRDTMELQSFIDELVTAVAEDLDSENGRNVIQSVQVNDCDLTDPTNTLLEELLCHVTTIECVTLTKCELPGIFCVTVSELKVHKCRVREVHVNALARWVEGGGCRRSLTISGETRTGSPGTSSSGATSGVVGVSENVLLKLKEACEMSEVRLTIG